MGSGRRMSWIQLLLVACVSYSSLMSTAAGHREVMSAPNILRVGTPENIFVEIQDYDGQEDKDVNIYVKNHPTKKKLLKSTSVRLTRANSYQGFGRVTIPVEEFSKDPKVKQYVNIEAVFPERTLEKVVLVTFQPGYIFIQTDKTIYTPASDVLYRIFALRPSMEPVEGGRESESDTAIKVEIETSKGIVIKSHEVSPVVGIYTTAYTLPEVVSMGQWKVTARFKSYPEQVFYSEFQVKEYVLPSFEVKLSTPPETPFFNVGSNSLTISIVAKYLIGKDVDGTAYVVFGVIDGENKMGFPGSLQRVPIYKGRGEATLTKEHITQTFKNIDGLEGRFIYVAVSLLTDSGGEMGEAELRGIKIVKSPYTISFKKTPKYFKPAMSFSVMVEVLNPDGSPAKDIPVVVDPGSFKAITEANGIARLSINTLNKPSNTGKLKITARTDKVGLESDRQATATMDAIAYNSSSGSYLHISVDAAVAEIGKYVTVTSYISNPEDQKDFTYLILSRGQLIHSMRFKNRNLRQFVQMLQVTKDMLPSFRIVAYYHTNDGELVSDSAWVDVMDTCMGSLHLSIENQFGSYEPRTTVKLKVTGDPGSKVGLVAVDKAVYVLNNKHRLTQKKIWDTVEQYDPGCSPGSGKNSLSVLYDAGVMLRTSTSPGTPERTESKCPSASRKKRASTIMDVRTSLLGEFNTTQECCLDGMREVPVSYSCERRTEYIVGDSECATAFLRCCKEMTKHRDETKDQILLLARSDTDNGYGDDDHITTRSQFPESWNWIDVDLNPCPSNDRDCKSTSVVEETPLQDSITTWQLTGISLSRTRGICVSNPLEVVVTKPFFIDLRYPYAIVRGEQVEIKAILHNWRPDPITVLVAFRELPGVCSAAYKKGWFQQEVEVAGESTRSVPFIIIPMNFGQITVEVKGRVKGSHYSDRIEKKLRVVPQGERIEIEKTVKLDPSSRRGGQQKEIINSEINTADIIPGTPMSTLIFLSGKEQMGTVIENAISGRSMETLIKEPYGCGEQNMMRMTLPVIATIYLDKINMWEVVGFDKRAAALQHIKTGYRTQLAFRKDDGSYSIWTTHKSTTWLTAYVTKVFAMSYDLIAIDKELLCNAIKFLILKTQQPDGVFTEIGEVYHKEMIGDVGGVDSETSITAFSLIAMQESKRICSSSVGSLPNSIQKAVTYLEKGFPRLTNPYAIAMASYALANEGKLNKDVLLKFASQDGSHWPVTSKKGHIVTLEATAYALLALVKAQAFQEAKPVVRWLSKQQKTRGGFGSTQATVMVYQAVAEYWTNVKEPAYNVTVSLTLPGKTMTDTYIFTNENHYAARTDKLPSINENITLTATGNGEAMFKMVSLYYVQPENLRKECDLFDLTLNLEPEKATERGKSFKLRIDLLYKSKIRNASMTILDIGLPTGYIFDKSDLDALSKGRGRIIAKYETNEALSDRGSLIIYLDQVSHLRQDEVSFKIHEVMKVGVMQPAAVSVYEYYNRKPCVRFYLPGRKDGALQKLCTDAKEACFCAEEGCTFQRKNGVPDRDRIKKACETQDSKIDYVYEVQVEQVQHGSTMDTYYGRVLKGIKEGSKDTAPVHQLRAFRSYQHCRDVLALQQNKTYLIMGSSSDIHIMSEQISYVLGQNTWVEYWPTQAESQQSTEHRLTYLGLKDLVQHFEEFKCQMK